MPAKMIRQCFSITGLLTMLTLGNIVQAETDAGLSQSHPLSKRWASDSNVTARANTKFGIGYEVWWKTIAEWQTPEAQPMLGNYSSLDTHVIEQHAEWLCGAGVDFIFADLSNSLTEIALSAVDKLFQVYSQLDSHPQVAFLLGTGTNGTLDQKADLIKNRYLTNATYKDISFQYQGNPLLVYYTGPTTAPPPLYSSPDFTVRFMGAFQEVTLNSFGAWAWLNRKPIVNGATTNLTNFSMSSFSGWHADPVWHMANLANVSYATSEVINGTQQPGNITSPPFTITAGVLQFNAIGNDFYAESGTNLESARNIFLLKDASTGTVLRSASPPGSTIAFYLRQWNVRSLMGRQVVFEAVNNGYANPANSGWFGFNGLSLVSSEFMSTTSFVSGNENWGGTADDWDAHFRYFGATLVYNMQSVYSYEPDIALVQQWNEFGAPDQFNVEASNDMEPTMVNKLAGVNSDGWGFYYLNLTRDLISQYREGAAFPAVMLDTRYP